MAANTIPGTRTSSPYTAEPLTLEGTSTRGIDRPITLYADGSVSGGSDGTGSDAACDATRPYVTCFVVPLTVAVTFPLAATHAERATPSSVAAALINISRAAAPAVASGRN